MVRELNTVWAFNPGAAVPGGWTLHDFGATYVFFFILTERLPHRYNMGCLT